MIKYLFLLFVFLRNINFISNEYPIYNNTCFQIKDVPFKTNREILDSNFCLKNKGYIANIGCREFGYYDQNICQICCDLTCGKNGILVNLNCIDEEENCIYREKYYWIEPYYIFGRGDEDAYFDLLSPIYYLFNFDYYNGHCYFQSREDLLISFAN